MTPDPDDHAPAPDADHGHTAVDDHGGDADQGQPAAPPGAAGEGDAAADAADAAEGASDPGEEFSPEQIDALVAERDEFLEAYRRTAADFDNFRKQSQKRLADEVVRTQGGFVERMLPVLDAIDAARSQGHEHVDAVASALYGFLEKEGLERVHPADEPFDPNLAEAVVHEPGNPDQAGEEPVVTEVLRTGYLWQGRVIRPAMVKVAG